MKNPWLNFDLSIYEEHMASENVGQLDLLNKIMKSQLFDYPVDTVTILGIAGGNGLDLISDSDFTKVYAIDINGNYLDEVKSRYPNLNNLILQNRDLNDLTIDLNNSQLIIANLILEYVGISNFIQQCDKINPTHISIVIQDNNNQDFLSKSDVSHELDDISNYSKEIDKIELINQFDEIGYTCNLVKEYLLPDKKLFIRIDFMKVI